MLRSLAGLLVCSLLVVGLAGCGADDAKKPTISKPTPATENSAATTQQKAKSE